MVCDNDAERVVAFDGIRGLIILKELLFKFLRTQTCNSRVGHNLSFLSKTKNKAIFENEIEWHK